jgi:hypothetical protein
MFIPPTISASGTRRSSRTPLPTPVTINLPTASALSGLSISSLREQIDAGTLRSALVCGRRLVFYDSFMKLLNAGMEE